MRRFTRNEKYDEVAILSEWERWRRGIEARKAKEARDRQLAKDKPPKKRKPKRVNKPRDDLVRVVYVERPPQKDLPYRPGMGPEFYRTRAWRDLRWEALKRSDQHCAMCGQGRRDGVKLHVDHIKPRARFPQLELSLDNLQVLCEDCNLGKRAQTWSAAVKLNQVK